MYHSNYYVSKVIFLNNVIGLSSSSSFFLTLFTIRFFQKLKLILSYYEKREGYVDLAAISETYLSCSQIVVHKVDRTGFHKQKGMLNNSEL